MVPPFFARKRKQFVNFMNERKNVVSYTQKYEENDKIHYFLC